MRVFITGATGFVGRALTLRLLGAGHSVTAWVRDQSRARGLLGSDVKLASTNSNIGEQIARTDAVVNLAGESVFNGRWAPARKDAIVNSRLRLTRAIVNALAEVPSHPLVLISASAVGYYGDRSDEVVEDDAPAGNGFLSDLCRQWELAALEARRFGARVFIPRFGIVLGAEEGALARMAIPFRFGAGGPIGSGSQYVSWIHIFDLVAIILAALEDQRMSGPVVAAAPNPVTSHHLGPRLARSCIGQP